MLLEIFKKLFKVVLRFDFFFIFFVFCISNDIWCGIETILQLFLFQFVLFIYGLINIFIVERFL